MKIETTLVSEVSELLREKGYCVQTAQVFKNGVSTETILVKLPDDTYMGVYVDRFVGQTAHDAVSHIEQALLTEDTLRVPLDDPEYVKQHVYIGLKKAQNVFLLDGVEMPIAKRPSPFDGIDEYLFIRQTDPRGTISVTLPPNGVCEIPEKDLWKIAYKNTCRDTSIMTIEGAILDLTREDDFWEPSLDVNATFQVPLYVVTNGGKHMGAAAILNRQAILKYAQHHRIDKIVMLPSSIHEVIIKPYCEDDIEQLTEIVKNVNACEVRPQEQLGDKAYLIDVQDYCREK